jgi:hypothetical protein
MNGRMASRGMAALAHGSLTGPYSSVRLSLRLFRVGMSGEDGEGAVELLGEHGAGKFV